MSEITTKRVYEDPAPRDGYRVLVDRLWPRGVSKDNAELDDWCKDLAPSDELRKWFDHDPDRWDEFQERYRRELEDKADQCQELIEEAKGGTLTLIYAAKDTDRNNAVVLEEFLVGLLNKNPDKR